MSEVMSPLGPKHIRDTDNANTDDQMYMSKVLVLPALYGLILDKSGVAAVDVT
jgi:hypothetical protein